MVASSSKVGNPALEDDEVGTKYISAFEMNELHSVKSLQQRHHIYNHAFGNLTFVLFPLF